MAALTDPLLDAVVADLAKPFDGDIEDHVDFEDVDAELMKRGTLSHGSIDWEKLDAAAIKLLGGAQKDVVLLEACVLCRLHKRTGHDFAISLKALDAYLKLDSEQLYPKNKKRFELLLKRLCDEVGKQTLPSLSVEVRNELLDIVGDLKTSDNISKIKRGKTFATILEQLNLQGETEPETGQGDEKQEEVEPKASAPAQPVEVAKSADSAGGAMPADPRAFKRTLNEICDTVYMFSPAEPLSYQLRRFGTWYDITAAPPIRSERRTIVPAVVVDTSSRYREAIATGSIDDELVLRLERSLAAMPFWIEGQQISAMMAQMMGRQKASREIALATAQFVARVDELRMLEFEDGSPIVPEDVSRWLSRATEEENSADLISGDEESAAISPVTFFGDSEAISKWDARYKLFSSNRQKALSELALLMQFKEAGLEELVGDQAKRMRSSVADMKVADWDQDFFAQLERLEG